MRDVPDMADSLGIAGLSEAVSYARRTDRHICATVDPDRAVVYQASS